MNIRPLSILFVAGILTAGCSDAEPPYMTLPAPMAAMEQPIVIPADVAGTWYSRVEKNAVNCGAGETVDAQVFVITQDETDISLLTSTGDLFAGTVNGDIVEWAGDYPERGGTSTLTSATLVFSAESGAGNAAWTWSDGTDSCNGTMAINVNKNAANEESSSNSRPTIADQIDFVDNVAFYTGSLGVGLDRDDYFKFSVADDAVIQAELSHFDPATTDLDILLFDEGLGQIAVSNSIDSFEMIEATVLAGQTYYIKVESRTLPGEVAYILSIDVN